MAGPGVLDLTIYHGDTFTVTLTIAEDIDLTGASIAWQVRSSSGALIADWSAYATVAAPQQIDIVVPGDPDEDGTLALPRPSVRNPKNYNHDLQITLAGVVRTIVAGVVTVQGDVSYG